MMKTYNVQLEMVIIPVDADYLHITENGTLVFKDSYNDIVRAFNSKEWKEVWVI